MLTDRVRKGLSAQMQRELYAAYLYIAMANYCESKNLPGLAHWLEQHSRGEVDHFRKLFDFLLSRGEQVELETVNAPQSDFTSVNEVFKLFLDNEERGEESFKRLYTQLLEDDCQEVVPMVSWFLESHVREVDEGRRMVAHLERIGGDSAALLMLDKDLASR